MDPNDMYIIAVPLYLLLVLWGYETKTSSALATRLKKTAHPHFL